VIDILFLARFYGILHENPFDRLSDVYDSIMKDFKPARKLGFTMFLQ